MTTKEISAKVCSSFLIYIVLLTATLCPAAQASDDDRQLAKKLSETFAVVAAEGKQFVSTRNALAKARLQSTLRLADNLAELQEARAIDLNAWEVVGEKYRLQLFNGVLTATATAVEQHAARANRQKQNKRDLEATQSAIKFQSSKLLAAGRSLAALSEPPAVKDSTELFNQLAQQLTGEATAREALLKAGKDRLEELKTRFLERALEDKQATPKSAP